MRRIDHPHGPWGENSDCILAFDIGDNALEILWARFVEGTQFEILSVPFFVYGVALGDIVDAPDLRFGRVLQPSGRWVIRVFFHHTEQARKILDDAIAAGGRLEVHGKLVAIDAPDLATREAIVRPLNALQTAGVLHWEPGEGGS